MKKIAIVTGANRGLGFQTSKELAKKGFQVCMLGRSLASVTQAAELLRKEDLDVFALEADVSSSKSVELFSEEIKKHVGQVDVLVNNAGILLDEENTIETISLEKIEETLNVNTLGPLRMFKALLELLKKSKAPRVVNVSSGLGQHVETGPGYIAYRMSKSALNMFTQVLNNEWTGESLLKVNSVCPGWVRTDMGGEAASRSLEEGASGILWAATLPDDGPSGAFFRDGKAIDW